MSLIYIQKKKRFYKNNQASGEDVIINEYIKETSDQFIVYEKLFNLIFESGIVPES